MRKISGLFIVVVLAAGCIQDASRDERALERAEERLQKARTEAAEKLREARKEAAHELERAREEADDALEEARERLTEARQRVRRATEDLSDDTEEWSRDSRREAERALEEVGLAETLGRVMEDVGRALQDEAPVSVAAESQLKALLPNGFAGLDRYDTNADMSGRWGIHLSQATAKYRDNDGNRASLTIADLGTLRGILTNSADLLDATVSKHNHEGFSRTTRVSGHPARFSKRERSGRDEFKGAVIVAERFVVVLKAEGDFDDDIFDDAFDAISFRRLSGMAE